MKNKIWENLTKEYLTVKQKKEIISQHNSAKWDAHLKKLVASLEKK